MLLSDVLDLGKVQQGQATNFEGIIINKNFCFSINLQLAFLDENCFIRLSPVPYSKDYLYSLQDSEGASDLFDETLPT